MSHSAFLLALQQSAGNAAVGTLLRQRMLQRQQPPAPPPSATPPAGSGSSGVAGKRPTPTITSKQFKDCADAVQWINGGGSMGDAKPKYSPKLGKERLTKQDDGTVKAEVDVTWSVAASSTMRMTIPTWPKMTPDEQAAVDAFKAALRAHEDGHFDIEDKLVAALQTTVTASGKDNKEAHANLQKELKKYNDDAAAQLKKAAADYDATTNHGLTQSAVGGADTKLVCPPAP